MMKLKKCLYLAVLSICSCSCFLMASTEGSIKAQAEFKENILELLKQKDFDAIKEYIQGIPDCDLTYKAVEDIKDDTEVNPLILEEVRANPVCTMDRINGKSFLWHVWQKGYNKEMFRFDIIEIDGGLYDALGNYYRFLYHAEPKDLNLKLYRNFYNRFIDTWLQERVELILTNLWQPGTIYRKWDGFSSMTGQNIYTTLYISYMLGFESVTKYVDPEIKLDKNIFGGGKDRLRTILKEMKQKSDETNTPQLLQYIKRSWYHSIAYSESDQKEKEYYQGKKHRKMFELLSGNGWEMFSDILDGVTGENLRREKHNIKVDIRNCLRIMQNAEVCDSFEKGAIKNGFYTPPVEYVEPTMKEKMKEMQNQIQEKLFTYQ